MTDKKVHCIAPFSSAVIIQDKFMPCCEWQHNKIFIDNDKKIEEHHDLFSEMRSKFFEADGNVRKVRNCNSCAVASKQYLMHNSYAKNDIDYFTKPTLTNLHLKFNNFCNLACRMCDPKSSSILAKEQNYKFNNNKNPWIDQTLVKGSKLYNSLFDALYNINRLWFSGGEPLIQEEVWEIIEFCVKKEIAKNIDIKFNTNGTVVLTQEQKNMLLEFNAVNIDISMDGIYNLAEYIRTKVVWTKWLKNFEDYMEFSKDQPQIEICIATALSIYNVHKLGEIQEFFSKYDIGGMSFTPVFFPKELCVANLNNKAKDYLHKKYTNHKRKASILEVFQLLKLRSQKVDIKSYVDKLDDNAIQSKMYKNYRPFKEIEKEWYSLL
jgi:MoaA/NifB/PqqE/SkfB family radical SAM enzyme